jgi:hypothetical protein
VSALTISLINLINIPQAQKIPSFEDSEREYFSSHETPPPVSSPQLVDQEQRTSYYENINHNQSDIGMQQKCLQSKGKRQLQKSERRSSKNNDYTSKNTDKPSEKQKNREGERKTKDGERSQDKKHKRKKKNSNRKSSDTDQKIQLELAEIRKKETVSVIIYTDKGPSSQ